MAIPRAPLLTWSTGNLHTYVLTAIRAYSLLLGHAHCCWDVLTVVRMHSGVVGLVAGGFSWVYGKGFVGRRNMFREGWRDTFATGILNHRGRRMVGVCCLFEVVVVMAYYRLSPGKESHISKQDIVVVRERYKNHGDTFTPD